MAEENRWEGLGSQEYTLLDLGRPAVFFLPRQKLETRMPNGRSISEELEKFLTDEFGGFTMLGGTGEILEFKGFWRDGTHRIVYDECVICEVSFVGKERIPMLLRKLAEIAIVANEECIYFKAGQYTSLVLPISSNMP